MEWQKIIPAQYQGYKAGCGIRVMHNAEWEMGKVPLCISHSALHISHSALHISHSALHISHSALHISHSALHISHSALHISHSALHISHSAFSIVRSKIFKQRHVLAPMICSVDAKYSRKIQIESCCIPLPR